MTITLPSNNEKPKALFSKLTVEETMRKRVITLAAEQTVATAVRTFIKHKTDAVLVQDDEGHPAGVVTKTEVMGAYYAALPIDTPLSDIMGSPVIQCGPSDSLESALIAMQEARIHRIYVTDDNSTAIGTLAYPDIVGALYKYCFNCDFGLRKKNKIDARSKLRYSIKEAMSRVVAVTHFHAPIIEVVEKLASLRIGALLIVDDLEKPAGVISKADLALAYSRGIDIGDKAATIMSSPAHLYPEHASLEEGIRQMILKEISRLFIHGESKEAVTGVLSLSDAARMRSGSCHACSTTRIRVKE